MSLDAIGLIGAGGQATEIVGYCSRPIVFYAVDQKYFVEGRPCIALEDPGEKAIGTEVVIALGAPGARRAALRKWPGRRFAILVADSSFVANSAELGRGTVVAPRAVVMAEAVVGQHVLLNTGAIISHECVIGDFATISPGALLGGRVQIGDGVFVGIGATVRDGVRIGSGAVIGAGAVVIGDVDEREVMVGVPARRTRVASEWLLRI